MSDPGDSQTSLPPLPSSLGIGSQLIDPIMAPDAVIPVPGHLERWADEDRVSESAIQLGGITRSVLTGLPLLCSDMFALAGCILMSFSLVAWFFSTAWVPVHPLNIAGVLLMCHGLVGAALGLYPSAGMNPVLELRSLVIAATIGHVLTLAAAALFGIVAGFQVVAVCLSGLCAGVLLPVFRGATRHVCSYFVWWGEPLLLVGEGPQTQAIYDYLKKAPHRGLRPVGVVDAPSRFWITGRPETMIGEIPDIPELVRRNRISRAIVNLHQRSSADRQELLSHCLGLKHLIVLHDQISLPSLWAHAAECAGLIGIRVRDRLQSSRALLLKRFFDLAGVMLAAPIVLSILLVLTCWIKLQSPGPVFYSQERIGRGGRRFRVWKVRTMVPHAEQVLQQYLDANSDRRDEWERGHKLRNDPRIIPGLGQLLRRTSLDELPQVWNVFRGEMSLVGPRPIVQAEIERYGVSYQHYQRVKPGITGLWQISGRNNTSYEHRVRLDVYYVRNWSSWLDYFILLRTLRTIALCEGAY